MQNPENERFDRMCNAFYETADLATDNEDKTNIVMKWIKGLNNELKKGHPPFKQKTSKLEQAVKKLQERKKKEGKREQVVKMNQGKKKKGMSAQLKIQ
ncbi:hypothetical protein IFM89_037061 [Coptis chinensis]|uniref:Uncharacterized protein n=1 Tax=Coptis chinensis TaxID=261450 RepID=A0A835LST4_9MAGN|nr:hypothetical protein IFM89_037061 [Coptis chinensis]